MYNVIWANEKTESFGYHGTHTYNNWHNELSRHFVGHRM